MELLQAVEESLRALKLGPEYAGAVQLAREVAAHMDATEDGLYSARWLAPELLKVLTALGATPVSLTAIKNAAKGGENAAPAPVTRLDQLRQSRTARRPAGS